MSPAARERRQRFGRYLLCDEIASGGMATVHLGRLLGPAGFTRTVAIKRLHRFLAKDPEFVAMLLDEAHLAARIRHPNVVATLDVIAEGGELLLVMDYVHGESLAHLLRRVRRAGRQVPARVAASVVVDTLVGLHAAHEATDNEGRPLGVVHRDISPQNVLVGVDGVARVADFGVAKAASRMQTTRQGHVKGKLNYMAPEQLLQKPVDRRCDVYAAGVVLWELLTGERLFVSDDSAGIIAAVLSGQVEPPTRRVEGLPPEIDEVVLRALAQDPEARYPTAREMARALERVLEPLRAPAVGEWVEQTIAESLSDRHALVTAVERIGEDSAGEVTTASGPVTRSVADSDQTRLSATVALVAGRRVVRNRAMVISTAALLILGGAVYFGFPRALRSRLSTPEVSAHPASARAQLPQERAVTAGSSANPSQLPQPPDSAAAKAEDAPDAATSSAHRPAVQARKPKPGAGWRPSRCDPPYTIDPNGVKRFNPDCFK